MPRNVKSYGNSERVHERPIRVEKENWWESVRRVATDRRTRMIVGILLLAFAVIALLAYVSFLFTGTYDQSVLGLERADRLANRWEVKNILGLPGAVLAQFLIDGSFGFVSVLLVLMVGVYGLRLMHVLKDIPAIKLFCSTTFWVLWGSVVLGFAQQMTHLGLFRWGGAFGRWAAEWLSSYVNVVGTIILLVVLLVIFLIVTDPHFIDRCKAFGAWCAGLFKKKEKPESPEIPEIPEEPTEPIDLPLTIEPTEPSDEPEPTEIPIEIEEPPMEPTEELPDEPLGDEPLTMVEQEEDKPKNPDLEIEEVTVEELYDKDPEAVLAKLGPYDPRKDLEF